jgi:hypothetical protein
MVPVFRKYDKVHRLGKEETEGILEGICHIEEKVDGANLSIWMDESGQFHVGSRNNDVTFKGFNGATEYVFGHEGIQNYLRDHPQDTLYGEWLVKHTIDYKATAYKKFYLFDIYDNATGEYLNPELVHHVAEKYGIEQVPYLGAIENPTVDQLKALMGKSAFGDRGEGVVVKNVGFKDKFGNHCYAKLVSESFKEDSGIVFGGNNKFSDTYWEMWIVNKYITLARVQKIMQKIQPMIDKKLDLEHIPRISSTVYHDMITEEMWEISGKAKKIDFDALKRIATKKTIQIYKDILNDSISVADQSR